MKTIIYALLLVLLSVNSVFAQDEDQALADAVNSVSWGSASFAVRTDSGCAMNLAARTNVFSVEAGGYSPHLIAHEDMTFWYDVAAHLGPIRLMTAQSVTTIDKEYDYDLRLGLHLSKDRPGFHVDVRFEGGLSFDSWLWAGRAFVDGHLVLHYDKSFELRASGLLLVGYPEAVVVKLSLTFKLGDVLIDTGVVFESGRVPVRLTTGRDGLAPFASIQWSW